MEQHSAILTSPGDDRKFNARTQFICITVAIGGLLFGFDTAVISGAIQLIKTQFQLSTAMEGWLVSSGLVGCIAGVLVTGLLSDRIGRRKTILLAAILFMVSAIGCAFPPGFATLVGARMVGGIGVGMASVISPMLIAEFAPAEKRGRMIAYYQLAITVGILLAYLSNALLITGSEGSFTSEQLSWFFKTETWRPMFLVMAIPSLVFLLMLGRIPESPRWLLAAGKEKQALDILQSIRPAPVAEKEFNEIRRAAGSTDASGIRNKPRRSVFEPAFRLPLLIGIVLAVFQQFSGINAIIYYGPSIFEAAGIDKENGLLFQVIIGAVNLVFTIVAIKWVDKYGRKFLLFTGLTGIVISLVLCGLLFYTGNTQGPLLLVLMLMYIACFAFSLGPVTWIIINEIFPTDIRVTAVTICTMALWIAVWMVGQFFPWLIEHMGPAVTFWIFAGCSLINFFFSRNVVKETKGRTLEEMENVFIAPH
ncbi:MAG: MFS transporter [Chitinophagaceae bacterium]|nr:MAG: MFS transporter [Chitinophagaceae bacterium]